MILLLRKINETTSIFFLVHFTGVTSSIIRTICKVVAITLTKYKDPFSQNLVRGLILSLLKHHADWALENFNAVFKVLINKELPNAPPNKASEAAIIALNWAIILTTNYKGESSEFSKLLEYEMGLYQIGLSSGDEKTTEKSYEAVKVLFSKVENAEKTYFEKVLSMEPASGVILFLIAYVKYSMETNVNGELFKKNKSKLLEHFIKGLISVKSKPNSYHITACRLLLKNLEKDEFKTTILPGMSRAMLRSPEVILKAVGAVVNELELDLSDCSMEMGKTLIQNLYSKDDTARMEAVESLKCLANKCNDAVAIEALIKQTFAVLNGSDGKITVAEYRINLLQVEN